MSGSPPAQTIPGPPKGPPPPLPPPPPIPPPTNKKNNTKVPPPTNKKNNAKTNTPSGLSTPQPTKNSGASTPATNAATPGSDKALKDLEAAADTLLKTTSEKECPEIKNAVQKFIPDAEIVQGLINEGKIQNSSTNKVKGKMSSVVKGVKDKCMQSKSSTNASGANTKKNNSSKISGANTSSGANTKKNNASKPISPASKLLPEVGSKWIIDRRSNTGQTGVGETENYAVDGEITDIQGGKVTFKILEVKRAPTKDTGDITAGVTKSIPAIKWEQMKTNKKVRPSDGAPQEELPNIDEIWEVDYQKDGKRHHFTGKVLNITDYDIQLEVVEFKNSGYNNVLYVKGSKQLIPKENWKSYLKKKISDNQPSPGLTIRTPVSVKGGGRRRTRKQKKQKRRGKYRKSRRV